MTKQGEPRPMSSLEEQLKARKPHRKALDLVEQIPGITSGKVVVQVLRKSQHSVALEAAYRRLDKKAENVPALKEDRDYVTDLRNIATLHIAIRDAKDPDGYPAFLSPEWMEEHLTPHELSFLLNAYNQFVGEVYPGGSDHLEPHKLIALLELCAEHAGTDIPNTALLSFTREMLAEVVVRAALLVVDAKAEAVEATAKVHVLLSAGVVPPEDGQEPADDALSAYAVRLIAADHENDILVAAAERVRTKRDAEIVMAMLGWKEGSQAWRRVLGEEAGATTS